MCPKFAGIPGHLASPASGQSGQIESETLQNTSLTKMTGCITRGEPNVSRGGSHKDNFDLCMSHTFVRWPLASHNSGFFSDLRFLSTYI